ncbi:MAG: glycosyltransferase family 4 protein [Acidobacteria bacterium]|nr:glycosyltransferase family 4 protein [Acidobacteriota bacterium]
MDLMAEMVMAHAGRYGVPVSPMLMRPSFSPMVRMPRSIRRYVQRFWNYPRWLRRQPPADVYHIVDHSYAHLASELPTGRVVVTCHDTDAFRTILSPSLRDSNLPRILVHRILTGFRRAAIVVCDSEAIRTELMRHSLLPGERIVVIPIAAHPSCRVEPEPEADALATILTGPSGGADLLHVGSTIPRKRLDVLLNAVAQVARQRPDVILWRVGGSFTSAQIAQVRELGLGRHIKVLPFVSRPVLAALYRRAALVLLPSEREGFGLPVVEAMSCGTPVLASDLAVLREIGGDAAEYCPVGAPSPWADRILSLLNERESSPARWAARQAAGLERASLFSWERYGVAMSQVYARVAASSRETRTCR